MGQNPYHCFLRKKILKNVRGALEISQRIVYNISVVKMQDAVMNNSYFNLKSANKHRF